MSLVVLAMTIALILVEDRLPISAILVFASVIFVPALVVDLLVLFGPGTEPTREPLARPRPRPRRPWFRRRTD